MGLPALRGHEEARAQLARAALAGNLAQSVLLHGPAGIGKERLGLWLGQLLVCDAPQMAGPCGECLSCRLCDRLEHPDVQWFFPLPRPDAASPEKLREKLEEARAAELVERRANPLHLPAYERPPAYFLAGMQALQQLAGMRPSMGRRKVLVVGDAELMVPQESSPEAANAFLKLLEEPPPYLTLILTTEQPGALLPTIRSRVLPYRLLPLPAAVVLDFLLQEGGIEEAAAGTAAASAGGAIGRALRLLPAGDTPGPLARQRAAGRSLLIAALSGGPVPRLAAANAQAPAGARGELIGHLDALADWLRDLLAVSSGGQPRDGDPEAQRLLRRAAEQPGLHPLGVTDAIAAVGDARHLAYGNVNPQLIVADLLRRMQRSLRPAGAGAGDQHGGRRG
jgi:DNA polymerase III subunit delta'